MNKERNYTGSAFLITLLVVVLLLGASRIPAFRVGDTKLKRINILSDIADEQAHPEIDNGDLYFDTTFLAEGRALEAATAASPDSVLAVPQPAVEQQQWNLAPAPAGERKVSADAVPAKEQTADVVPVEDFGTGSPAMTHFYDALLDSGGQRPVRIAVLGDSFIEGDIITADLRERLQDAYGGCGVGFVPFSSAVATLRSTVKHTFDGWETSNVKDFRHAPEGLKDKFFISGNLCVPSEGASVRLEGVGFRKHIDRATVARIIFINRQHTQLNVVVNDTLSRVFTPDPSPYVQQITIQAPIRSIGVTLTGTEGFIGYGIELEDAKGVCVDNYSIRGNSGLALFGTNSSINLQIGNMLGYDLIVLQYGLNVMSADVTRYDSYADSFVKVINYMKQCFPGSSILVMGVGDRSTQRDGQFVTMPGVRGMIAAQRRAAEQAGVAFWNTFDAMGGENSMVRFVEKNWAAKDYTHIGYRGGKQLALQLVGALNQGLHAESEKRAAERKPDLPSYEIPAAVPEPQP